MKPTQQQKDNKLIAEFMGLTIITDNISYFDTNYKALKNYHIDWNWLMEVVEKIESLDINKFAKQLGREEIKPIEGHFYLNICKDNAEFLASVFYWQHDNNIKGINNHHAETKIEAVYNACIEFIKWYNKENK